MIQALMLAACGWFLLLPPLGPNDFVYDDRPYPEWTPYRAYDSAKECERDKVSTDGKPFMLKGFEYAQKKLKDPKLSAEKRKEQEALRSFALKTFASRCISSDLLFSSQPKK